MRSQPFRLSLAGRTLGAVANEQEPGAYVTRMQCPHRQDQRPLVLLRSEPSNAEEKWRGSRDRQRSARLGPAPRHRRRLDAIADRRQPGAGTHARQSRCPTRRCRVRHRDEGVHRRCPGGVVRLLSGLGDQPRQMLGSYHPRPGRRARDNQRMPLPADAGMDVQHVGAQGVEQRRFLRGGKGSCLEVCGMRRHRKARRHLRKGEGDTVGAGKSNSQRQHVLADARRLAAIGCKQNLERFSHAPPKPVTPARPRAGDASQAPGPPPGPC